MGIQPPDDDRRGVRAVVVADQVDVQAGGNLLIELGEEFAELAGPVPAVDRPDDLTAGHVQGGEQGRDAMPQVVVRAPLRHAGHHRQHRR
jgi:hypothetical protein